MFSFESDFQRKLLRISFDEAYALQSKDYILQLRKQWMEALSAWHSPYKVIVDLEKVAWEDTSPHLQEDLQKVVTFFEGFFLRKIVGFTASASVAQKVLPFEVCSSEQLALKALGVRQVERNKDPQNFRSMIGFESHFATQIIEVFFHLYI